MSLPNPAELIRQMATDLNAHLSKRGISDPRFIGIRTGGVWVAQALLKELDNPSPLGTLDVSFYRDDFSQNGLHPQVRPSELPFEIEGQHLVLAAPFAPRSTNCSITAARPASRWSACWTWTPGNCLAGTARTHQAVRPRANGARASRPLHRPLKSPLR